MADTVAAEGGAPTARARWGLGDAVGGFVVGVVAATVLVGILVVVEPRWQDEGLAVVFANFAGLWVGLAGAPLVASRWKGAGSLRDDFGFRLRPGDVAYGALGAGLQFAVALVYLPLRPWIDEDDVSEAAEELVGRAGHVGPGFFALAVIAVLGAPVVEELFFRGLVQRAAARRWGVPVAVAVSALAFGLAHLQLLQLPALVVVGLVSAGLAARTGRLGPSILLHLGFNAVAMVQLGLDLAGR